MVHFGCMAFLTLKAQIIKSEVHYRSIVFPSILNQSPYFSHKDAAHIAFMMVLVNKLFLSNTEAGTTFTRFHYIFQQWIPSIWHLLNDAAH